MKQKDYFTIVGITSKNIDELQEAAKNPVFTIDLLAKNDFFDQDGFYVADPFVFLHNSKIHIFCEVLTTSNKGFIGKYVYDPKTATVMCPKLVLEESFHLSYPQIIRYEGEIFMLPETNNVGDIRLYKAENENLDKWVYHSTLIKGVFHDTTPLFHNGKWYLFTCSERDFSVMHIFTSDTLFAEWVEHPMSPFPFGSSGSRPAGPILTFNDKMYRLAQDCSNRYGQAVKAFEIEKLTENDYVEAFYKILLKDGDDGYNTAGMHHLQHVVTSDQGDFFVADGYRKL